MTDIVTQLFSAVDTAAANSIQTIYQSLTAGLQPVLVVAMTVYVAYWGLEMIFGRASLSAGAFVWKILKIALIWSLALGWSDFSTFVAQVFVHGGDGIATAVCTGAGGTNCSSAEASVSSSLSTLLANALAAAKVVASSGSGFSVVGLAILGPGAYSAGRRLCQRRNHAGADRQGGAVRAPGHGAVFHLDGAVRIYLQPVHRLDENLRAIRDRPADCLWHPRVFADDHERGDHQSRGHYRPLVGHDPIRAVHDLVRGWHWARAAVAEHRGVDRRRSRASPLCSAATLHTRSRNPSAGDAGRGNSRHGRPWAFYSRIQPRRPHWRGALGITDARSNDPPGW